MVKKRGLGRGLDALLGVSASTPPAAVAGDTTERSEQGDTLRMMPVDMLQRGQYQPRVDMHAESLEELAASIRAQGVVQPIVIRPIGGGRYEIIAGERRWRAAQLAELSEIPVIIKDVPDQAAMSMALIENIQRENLNPIEEAAALSRLVTEFELTHQQVAEAVGRSRAAVSNLMRLLDLEATVREMMEQGQLEMGHGRALLSLPASEQAAAAQKVAQKGLSVRETERLVKSLMDTSRQMSRQTKKAVDPNIQSLEQDLSERLGAGVSIAHSSGGKGKLVISYNSLDELDGILSKIK